MKKMLVFGGSGLVGSKFTDMNANNFEIISPDISEVDILNKDAVLKKIEELNPDTVINFAAFTNVEEAENQRGDKGGICYLINVVGAKNVADACKHFNKKLIHVSTEYVFDGEKSESPYVEDDKPNPINWYGQTKYFAEQAVLESSCSLLIMRICMPFSASYKLKKDVARFFLEQLRAGSQIKAVRDQRITPTLVNDIAHALGILIKHDALGFYHVSSKSNTTPFEFAKKIAEVFGLSSSLIESVLLDVYNENKKAKILRYSWLDSSKFSNKFGAGVLHTVEENINIFKKEIDSQTSNPI